MRIPGSDERGRNTKSLLAADDASRLTDEAPPLLDRALGVEWYERAGNEVPHPRPLGLPHGEREGTGPVVVLPARRGDPLASARKPAHFQGPQLAGLLGVV